MTSQRAAGPVVMDQDQVWQVIDAQRLKVVSLLEQLSPDEWQQPSLCACWTVRDVAAHLTLQQLGLPGAIGMMARWRGSPDRTIHDAACRRAAAWPADQIIAGIRGTPGSRRHNIGVTYLETLTDILVHGQDLAIPLGRRHDMPPRAAATAATRVLSMRWPPPLPAARKAAGFRLTATDICWSAGDGPQVNGPIHAILLVCTGRLTALPQLSGEGAHDLTARLSPPKPL
jgi:uncharacterized protein (TIGR03083 family)